MRLIFSIYRICSNLRDAGISHSATAYPTHCGLVSFTQRQPGLNTHPNRISETQDGNIIVLATNKDRQDDGFGSILLFSSPHVGMGFMSGAKLMDVPNEISAVFGQ